MKAVQLIDPTMVLCEYHFSEKITSISSPKKVPIEIIAFKKYFSGAKPHTSKEPARPLGKRTHGSNNTTPKTKHAGQTFVDAGVPHVVCCQQEAQLMDNAALSFTRAFYLALAFGRTVKESFDIGKQAVLNSPTVPNATVEMEKFMLLPEDGNHEVAVLDAEPVPEWPLLQPNGMAISRRRSSASSSDDTATSSDHKLPSLAQGFSGRETDMYHVLNLVLSRRLVNITGPSGMGRSSLAIALCHYIDERKSTMMFGQIFFVRSTAKRKGRSSPIFSLCEQIESMTNKKGSIPTNLDLDETVEIILRALRKTKTLLVFERIEALEGADAQDFQFFLGQILAETKDVHVLISSDKSLGQL